MNEPNPFDSPHGPPSEPEPKKWWQLTTVEWVVVAEIIVVLIGLLLPSFEMAGDDPRRHQSANNLKYLGIAMHNYHDTYGSLPPAVVTDRDGRPLYSWRVLLLPFMEEKRLYEKFDLTQPWDSETNRPLAEFVPGILQSPYLDRGQHPGKTTYVAVVDPQGKQTLMLSQEGRRLDEVTYELGSVVMVVEQIDHPVIWTKPDDISPFKLIGAAQIGQNDPSYFPAMFADASVRWIPADDRQQLKEYLLCQMAESTDETSTQD